MSPIVVDWTRSAARVGLFVESNSGWELGSELTLPSALALRLDETNSMHVLMGNESADWRQDENTLIFEHPARDLLRIEDEELQNLLLAGFWHALGQNLISRGLLREHEQIIGYLIPPLCSSSSLLKKFEAICADERPIKLSGVAHEAVALILGVLRYHSFEVDGQTTICLVVVCDEQRADVVCFDYVRPTSRLHQILIRDFFHTTCADLSARLHDCDWLGAFSLLVTIKDPTLPEAAESLFNAPLQAIADGVARQDFQIADVSQLKLKGCADIARFAAGRGGDDQEYEIANACHIGLQTNLKHFEPIINKNAGIHITEFPHFDAQAFRLHGHPGSAMRLNFYSGYSTRVADAFPLGHVVLSQDELAQLKNTTSLTAAVRLDAPGSGELLLGLMPENRLLRRHAFTLPALVV